MLANTCVCKSKWCFPGYTSLQNVWSLCELGKRTKLVTSWASKIALRVLLLFKALCTHVHTTFLWSKYSGLSPSSCSFSSLASVHICIWHKLLLASDDLPLPLQLRVQLKLPSLHCQLSSSGKFCAFLYFFFLDISSNYFPSALIFLKLNEGRWYLHLPELEGVSNPLNLNWEVELRV